MQLPAIVDYTDDDIFGPYTLLAQVDGKPAISDHVNGALKHAILLE